MTIRGPRYTKEEFARRGDAIFERDIQPKLKPDDRDKFVAIDIETGDFEIDSDSLPATTRLISRHPDAQVWVVRVGHRAAVTLRSVLRQRG
jgi:hypothetical protein